MNMESICRLVDHAAKRKCYVEYCRHYGEPRYEDPKEWILFADWNHVPRYVRDGLERRGFALEWDDEWIIEYNESKAFRTSPDCHSWLPSYLLTDDCEIWDRRTMPLEDYAEHLLNSTQHCDTVDRDFMSLGFKRIDSETYESGWRPGQTDSPDKVLAKLRADGFDVIFATREQSQFYTTWQAWIRPIESEETDAQRRS